MPNLLEWRNVIISGPPTQPIPPLHLMHCTLPGTFAGSVDSKMEYFRIKTRPRKVRECGTYRLSVSSEEAAAGTTPKYIHLWHNTWFVGWICKVSTPYIWIYSRGRFALGVPGKLPGSHEVSALAKAVAAPVIASLRYVHMAPESHAPSLQKRCFFRPFSQFSLSFSDSGGLFYSLGTRFS